MSLAKMELFIVKKIFFVSLITGENCRLYMGMEKKNEKKSSFTNTDELFCFVFLHNYIQV